NSINIILRRVELFIFIKEMAGLGIFVIPILTANSIAKERITGELELILSSGIKSGNFILGKVLFLLSVFLFISLYFLILPLAYYVTNVTENIPDLKSYIILILGYMIISGLYISIGIFISSRCVYPATAGGITFGIFLFIFFLGTFPVFFPLNPLSEMLKMIIPEFRLTNILHGIIKMNDLVYFFTSITFFIGASIVSVKWKKF
ncbi:MAG: ABC transporter permease, partial [bacterium]|nr:ABC transporter permease [bacterium]